VNPTSRGATFREGARHAAISFTVAAFVLLPIAVRAADEPTAVREVVGSSVPADPALVLEIRNEIESQYRRMAEAYVRKDRKTIFNVLSPDYHRFCSDGSIEDIKLWRERIKLCLRSHWDGVLYTVEALRVSENALIALAEVTVQWSLMPELAGERQSGRYRRRDAWVKSADGWRLKMADDFRDLEHTVGGKRVDPMGSSPNSASIQSDSTSTIKP
jgi:hypothetical protein